MLIAGTISTKARSATPRVVWQRTERFLDGDRVLSLSLLLIGFIYSPRLEKRVLVLSKRPELESCLVICSQLGVSVGSREPERYFNGCRCWEIGGVGAMFENQVVLGKSQLTSFWAEVVLSRTVRNTVSTAPTTGPASVTS